ncbi:uncharacterized protein LOC131213323 [Anopheles bellator]|uniref:uncharacterized protein LOC131213323 n=1 Tax=Anopheles bellator TaxID=139047 RepID=UPI00264A0A3A|nr:uncharacterized protein LOC131213323 [Anopheles bellator]
MDFFKSVLPPLPKLPKMKKIRQWNRGTLLNLSPFPHLPSPFNFGPHVGGGGGSGVGGHRPPGHAKVTAGPAVIPRQALRHTRHTSDISSISATVDSKGPAGLELRDNYGLYALKCDRNAAKRGILLHLPRKITQAVAGGHIQPAASGGEMVHEKFSPCKQRPATEQPATIQAPPRRRKRPPKATPAERCAPPEVSGTVDRGKWQKNSSELFRIVERESANAARLRSTGGLGLQLIRPPLPGVRGERRERREYGGFPRSSEPSRSLRSQLKARSMDNLAATHHKHPMIPGPVRVGQINDVFSDDSDDERRPTGLQVRTPTGPVASASASQISQTKMEASTGRPEVADLHEQLKRATFFSIDNNSDEIEIRFRNSGGGGGGGSSTDESSEADTLGKDGTSQRLPLPARVAQLRCETIRSHPQPAVVVPLAEVLKRSLDSGELKRRWLNNLLADGSLAPDDAIDTERKDNFEGSVDIFHQPACDFQEFDTLFPNAFTPKIGNTSAEIRDVDHSRSTASLQQLCFSSSSFSSHDAKAETIKRACTKHRSSPSTTPPWGAGCQQHVRGPSSGSFRSTVRIQDYSSKQLQRVRYLASPSPSRSSLTGQAPSGCHSPVVCYGDGALTSSSTPGGVSGCNQQPQQNGTLPANSGASGRECLRGSQLPLVTEGAGPHSVIPNYDEFYNEEGVVII